MVTERVSDAVLLDPSLILAQSRLHRTMSIARRLTRGDGSLRFYYSSSLLRMIVDRAAPRGRFSEFLSLGAREAEAEEIQATIERNSDILRGFEVGYAEIGRHEFMYDALGEELSYLGRPMAEYARSVLMEEWVFLQERSWVVSSTRRPFRAFVNAGSTCLEFGARTTDALIRRTLKQPDGQLISRVDRLRAFGKWIAVSGSAVAGAFTNPIVSTTGPLLAGFFLLFDP